MAGSSDGEVVLEVMAALEGLMERMIVQQRKKVMTIAEQALPNVSFDDVLSPEDFPELKSHPRFDYEDGQLAGLLAAQMAVRVDLRRRLPAPSPNAHPNTPPGHPASGDGTP